MEWAELRTIIYRTFLADTGIKYDADVLRDCVWGALDTFCSHTAMATSTSVAVEDPVPTQLPLPENIYDGALLDTAGAVYVRRGTIWTFLRPLNFSTPGPKGATYKVWGRDVQIDYTLKDGDTLCIDYYAYYNHPYADTDTIDVPPWARTAISYLTAGFALSGRLSKQTNIAQFRTVEDRGNPVQNSMMEQQLHYLTMYETEIKRVSRQNRTVRLK